MTTKTPARVTTTAARLIGPAAELLLTRTEALQITDALRAHDTIGDRSLADVIERGMDAAPRVVDDSHRADLPTGRVLLTCPAGTNDSELLAIAGYDADRHFGVTVTRHDDGMATVSLWND